MSDDEYLYVTEVAADQGGLITAAQGRTIGANRQDLARWANQGRLERVCHGVYRVAAVPASELDELRAAWLALDPAATARERLHHDPPIVVSHRSAAKLHSLGTLDADVHEFTAPTRKQTRREDVKIHRGQLSREEWESRSGIAVTTPMRTITDLADARTDGSHMARIVRGAVTRELVDVDELAVALDPRAPLYAVADGRSLVAQWLRADDLSALARAVELVAVKYTTPMQPYENALNTLVERMRVTPPLDSAQVNKVMDEFLESFEQVQARALRSLDPEVITQVATRALQTMQSNYGKIER